MATQAQIEANRRNSQKSTGPRTEAGKLSCSQNAFKSGIYAEAPLVTGEDPATLDELAVSYRTAYRPASPDERALVETLIHTDWLLRRMRRVETQLWNRQTDKLHQSSFYNGDPVYELAATYSGVEEYLDRLQRRLCALERIYRRNLADLRRLQSARPQPPNPQPLTDSEPAREGGQIGFVPLFSNEPTKAREASEIPDPPLNL
jgi:hypothetical protein